MALVQVKQVFRVGVVQRVSRYVSPPQPSSSTSFLWKSDSMSRQRRSWILAQVTDCRRTFFATSSTADAGSESAAQGVDPTPEEVSTTSLDSTSESAGASNSNSNTDGSLLDRTYGQQQEDHQKVANDSHERFANKEDEGEGLEDTGYDISKVSKPSGDE